MLECRVALLGIGRYRQIPKQQKMIEFNIATGALLQCSRCSLEHGM